MVASKAFYRHDFPAPHTDSVESVIDYRVPPGKFTALAEFDGGVIAERTAISRLASTALAFQRVVVIARRWIFGARIARPDDHRFRYNTFHSPPDVLQRSTVKRNRSAASFILDRKSQRLNSSH